MIFFFVLIYICGSNFKPHFSLLYYLCTHVYVCMCIYIYKNLTMRFYHIVHSLKKKGKIISCSLSPHFLISVVTLILKGKYLLIISY